MRNLVYKVGNQSYSNLLQAQVVSELFNLPMTTELIKVNESKGEYNAKRVACIRARKGSH